MAANPAGGGLPRCRLVVTTKQLETIARLSLALGVLGLVYVVLAGPAQAAEHGWVAAVLLLVYLGAVSAAVAGAFMRRHQGPAWFLMATGLAGYATSAFIYALDPVAATTFPSPADVGLIVFYPFAMATIVLRVRMRFPGFGLVNWMDMSISAFAVAAVGALALLPSSLDALTANQLSYVVGDLVLVGFLAAALTVAGSRATPALRLMAVGIAIMTIGDAFFVNEIGTSHLTVGLIPSLAWPTGALLVGAAPSAWWRVQRAVGPLSSGRVTIALPVVSAVICLPIAIFTGRADEAARVLAGLALLAVVARLSMNLREREKLVHRLSEVNDELAHAAEHDVLTGLGNRVRLTQIAGDGALEPGRVLVLVDLDGFKAINDTFGHITGDRVLQAVADRLRAAVRPDDGVVRLGGDEFAALLANADEGASRAVAARFLRALQTPMEIDGNMIFVRASVGVAVAAADESLSGLLPHADAAMYQAKSSGGLDQISVFDPKTHHHILDNLALASALRGALARGELILHYQPIVDMATRRTVGLEALVRWQHPERGIVSPGVFIPLAEQGGLMPEIGQWILEEACREACRWGTRGANPPSVSVNLSVTQLQDSDFLPRFDSALARSRLPLNRLVLEVTETALATEDEAIRSRLDELRRRGVRVYIDDFGTGYSSLGYIRNLPLDGVKLDQAFARDLTTSPEAWAVAQAIVALLENLNLTLIAEGVESAAQLAQLRSLGCEYAQGYYFARPQSPDALDDQLSPDAIESAF
jgi:diguanylate cyclase (GGDEF)-like protein